MNSFGYWLQGEMNRQGLGQRELARRAKVSQGSIGNVIRGDRAPGSDLCTAIARGLKLPPETVFRAAGILPNHPGTDEDFEELKHIFKQMTEEEQEEFLATGRLKIELRNKRGEIREMQQTRPANI